VELMTEVGVDVIVPWAAQRCVAQWRPGREDKALARWRSTAREAAKQSRRSRFPQVAELARTADVLARLAGNTAPPRLALLLDPGGQATLTAALAAGSRVPAAGGEREILLIVGPEGGLSDEESASLAQAGAVPVRLGPAVLRGSTAGAVAAALVMAGCGRWA
jgi:16S rRNA (uracil1498-N3)-methyltransferase